jgi:hypothetical protein
MMSTKLNVLLAAGLAFVTVGLGVAKAETVEVVAGPDGCTAAFSETVSSDNKPVSSVVVSCPRPPVQIADVETISTVETK